MRRRALAGAIVVALTAGFPVVPLRASAALIAPSTKAGSYGRLGPGTTVRIRDLRRRASTIGPRRPAPLVVRNPAAYAAAKATTGRTPTPTLPRARGREMGFAVPLVSQGADEEQLTVFPGMDLTQGTNALGPDQSREPPDTQIAAGPTSLVATVNSTMSVWSKSGSRLQVADLNAFYAVPSGYTASDSRILFDGQSNRFIMSSVALDAYADSVLELAVSQTSDPTGSWTRWQIKTTLRQFIDQPMLGTSDDKVTLAWMEAVPPPCEGQATFFCFTGQAVAVLQKSDLLASAAPRTFTTMGDLNRFGIVPAQALSPTSTQYLVYNNADPYFLVENACSQPSPPGYYGSCPTLGEISLTGTPAAHNIATSEADPQILSTTAPANATQFGSTTFINTGDDRLLSAVWRDNRLLAAASDGNNCPTANQPPASITASCVQVILAATDAGGMVLADNILGANNDYIYDPAASLDNAGDIFVVFSRSNSGIYPSVLVTGLLNNLGAAAWSPNTVLKVGNGPYDSTSAACGGHNRWGDYSGAAADPTDPTDVWVAGEYTLDIPNTCVWGTVIGRLTYSAPTVTSVTPATGPGTGGTAVTITGTDFVTGSTTTYFGATPSTTTTVLSPNTLTTSTPPGNGWVAVSASTGDGHGPPGPTFKYPRVEAAPGSFRAPAGTTTRSGTPPAVPPSPAGPRPGITLRSLRLLLL